MKSESVNLLVVFFVFFCTVSCFGKDIKNLSVYEFLNIYDSIPEKNEKDQFLKTYLDTVVYKRSLARMTSDIDELYRKGVLDSVSESDKNKLTHIILTNRLYDNTINSYCPSGVKYLCHNMTNSIRDSIRNHYILFASGKERSWERRYVRPYDIELNYGKILLKIGDEIFIDSVFSEVKYHFPKDKVIFVDSINHKTLLFFKTLNQADFYYKNRKKDLCDLLIYLLENYSDSYYLYIDHTETDGTWKEYSCLFDLMVKNLSNYIDDFPRKKVKKEVSNIKVDENNGIVIFRMKKIVNGIQYNDVDEDYKKEVLRWCSQHKNDYNLKNIKMIVN